MSPAAPAMAVLRLYRPAALLLLAALGSIAGSPALMAQDMLNGCQLVQGELQCVPGVNADPQQQIRDLRQQIATDQNLENAVQQRIDGLQQLVLMGQLAQGSLLMANLGAGLAQDPLINMPPGAFHWYRLPAGGSQWVLISGASGPNYRLQPADVGSQVMVVIAVPAAGGSQRQMSTPVGPVGP